MMMVVIMMIMMALFVVTGGPTRSPVGASGAPIHPATLPLTQVLGLLSVSIRRASEFLKALSLQKDPEQVGGTEPSCN